jgi:phytoene dehydrogenase-like protein
LIPSRAISFTAASRIRARALARAAARLASTYLTLYGGPNDPGERARAFVDEIHRLTPRTPIEGLYFCGAATDPGGSVIALNGRNAAMAVPADAHVGAPAS